MNTTTLTLDTLSGSVANTIKIFTNNNPDEGAKITVKVQQGSLVPTPGAIALVAASGLFGVRRRR